MTAKTELFWSKSGIILFSLLLFVSSLYSFSVKPELPFYLYCDGYRFDLKEYYIPSGWSGDVLNILYDLEYTNHPQSGTSCIKITYLMETNCFFNWAGITWQYPSCNWGNIDGGLDLTDASQLSFWARGETGLEVIFFTIGGCYGVYSDTAQLTLGPVRLTRKWRKYTIPFNNEDLTHISWGFSCYFSKYLQKALDKTVFYLDNIMIEKRTNEKNIK